MEFTYDLLENEYDEHGDLFFNWNCDPKDRKLNRIQSGCMIT